MKKLFIFLALLVLASSACAETKTIHSAPMIISYSPEDALFYEACYQNALTNMVEPDRSDPELAYHTQAEYCDSQHESVRKLMAKENNLWGLAGEEDIPRNEAMTIGYAALEQIAEVPRKELHMYYTDAWMNVSDPDRPIWKVHCSLSAFYRSQNENADSYHVYVDSRTGEVLCVEVY